MIGYTVLSVYHADGKQLNSPAGLITMLGGVGISQ